MSALSTLSSTSGDWGEDEFCPFGSYATGVELKASRCFFSCINLCPRWHRFVKDVVVPTTTWLSGPPGLAEIAEQLNTPPFPQVDLLALSGP